MKEGEYKGIPEGEGDSTSNTRDKTVETFLFSGKPNIEAK